MFAYQTLDNMDGKQARRTGSSSPLGQVFDHGCDAMSTILLALAVNAAVGAGWHVTFGLIFIVCGAFYFATWEELHTGMLYLGVINGASEGTTIGVLLFLTSAINGSAWWAESVGFTIGGYVITRMSLYAASTALMSLGVLYSNVKRSFVSCRDGIEHPHGVSEALVTTFPLALIMTLTIYVLWAWEAVWEPVTLVALALTFGFANANLVVRFVLEQHLFGVTLVVSLYIGTWYVVMRG